MTDSCFSLCETHGIARTPLAPCTLQSRVCLAPSSDAVEEGADQPVWQEMVANQALMGGA